jgi:hypothetical protein
MKPIATLSILALTFFLVCCNENSSDITNNNSNTAQPAAQSQSSDPGASSPDTKKSDGEMYLEAFTAAANVASDALENKRMKDSVKLAHKEKMYAYQIGLPMKEKDQVFDLYKKLGEAEVKNVYVVRNPDDDYILVQYEAKEQDLLYENLKNFRDSLSDITSEKIAVVNLTEFCSKKDIIKKDGTLKKKREDVEIPCLVCD